jgi:HEAT repeat protein
MFFKKLSVRIFHLLPAVLLLFIILGDVTLKAQSSIKADSKTTDNKKISADNNKNAKPGKGTESKHTDNLKKETKPKEAAGDIKKAEKIESTLEFGIQKDRKAAINMIKDIKDEQIKNKLLQKIALMVENDPDIDIRKACITSLGDHKATQHSNSIIKALDDSTEDIQIAACYALSMIKADQAKPKLVELFKKQDLTRDSNLADSLIAALMELNSSEILDTALGAIKDKKTSKMIRERLLLYIGKAGSAAQKDFLLEIYKNDDEDIVIRSYAIKSLGKLKIKDSASEIKTLLKEIDSYPFSKRKQYYDLYMHSVAALVELGDTDSVPLLMNSLRSDNAGVRLKAVNLIKEFNDERTIDILKYKMKNDPSRKVRKAARKALEDKGLIEKGKDNEDLKEEYDKDNKDE